MRNNMQEAAKYQTILSSLPTSTEALIGLTPPPPPPHTHTHTHQFHIGRYDVYNSFGLWKCFGELGAELDAGIPIM